MKRLCFLVLLSGVAASAIPGNALAGEIHQGNWLAWRGPLQTGVSLESYDGGEFDPEPIWTDGIAGRGTPLVFNGRIYSWGYRGKGPDLEEVLQARDEKTGEVLWERTNQDFISDTVYDRYTIGSPAIDPETGNVILASTYGLVTCYDPDGKQLWQHSMIERFGRLTFPNGRAGAPVIDGGLVIIRGVTSYWGADGPARDRFFGFDKNTGELVWSSTPGVGPPYLKDSSMSTPYLETRDNKRVFYAGTGCGNIVCVNVNDGTALWRYQIAKGGVNSSPVVLGDELICVHGKENLDSTEVGRLFAIRLPGDLNSPGGEVDPEQGGAPRLPQDVEVWRNRLEMFTSSPVLHENRIYQAVKTGMLYCVDAESGKTLWEMKLSNEQLHASPVYADGMLFVPMFPGEFYVIDVTGDEGRVLHKLKVDGNCIGSPAVCNGRVYLHTTEKLYAFQIKNSGIHWAEAPQQPAHQPGPVARLLPIPSDVLLKAGESAAIRVKELDADGFPVGDVAEVSWEKFVPPTAKVKAEMDAGFDGNTISAAADAAFSAGAWKGTAAGGKASGILRGRTLAALPYHEDLESFEVGESGFAFPPLPWIGARLKWEIRELDGNKVLQKTLDRLLFQRTLSFIGDPDWKDYTLQADVMTDGNRRTKSTVGLINQRYIIALVGNTNVLEVSSNYERLTETAPFPVSANQWYTLKTRVDVAEDGSGVVRGKAWVKGEPEPEAWTIEVKLRSAHRNGAPGLFGFSPQAQKTVYIDNISVTAN